MAKYSLNISGVVFTSDPHSYHLGTKELKGVTGILSKHIFRDKYFNVSDEVLAKAAERGTRIHEQCRAVDILGMAASEEAEAYANIKKQYGLEALANEYTVSDNENVASNIDFVSVYDGDKIVIGDFKTTSHLDIEYLSWQLSIYKYLFEMQNPHLQVYGLMGVWLPKSSYGKPKAEWIPEKPREEIINLLKADANGELYTPPLTTVPPSVLVLQQRCYNALLRLSEAKKESEALHEALQSAMERYDVKKWENDDFSVTRILPSTRKSFDSAKFKEEHPDMYESYTKTSETKGSVKITLKKKK